MKVLGSVTSGNCYKVKLALTLLDIKHEWQHTAIPKGDTQTPEFLALNPNGMIPVLVLDDGQALTESNAIVDYLAEGTWLMPTDRLQRARVLEWQFFEQYNHEPNVGTARFIRKFLGLPDSHKAVYEEKLAGGYKALGIMERQLSKTPYLTGQHYTAADISLYAYTHVAHEGGFDLTPYPAIRAWLERIQQHPKHVAIG